MDSWQYRPARDQNLPPAEKLRSLKREAGLAFSTTQMLWRVGTSTYLRGYHRLQVTGGGHIPPQPPFVMIANHASHLDVLMLAAALPWQLRHRAFPIAAGDAFFETPATSLFSAMMLNALPLWRKRCGPHTLQELRDRLVSDSAIYLLFPEGQRSRDGTMHPFKPGLGMLIAGTGIPVVPCYLEGAFAACPPGSRFPRPRKLRVHLGKPVIFADVPNQRAGWQEIATQLQTAVQSLRGLNENG